MNTTSYPWRFFRAGGFDQVKLETGADLVNLDKLDQKLWVALACPTTGLEFDPRTLALVDTDKDGRIRAPELIAAVKWAGAMLRNPDTLTEHSDPLPLAAFNDSTPDGKQLLASARQILANLGKKDALAIAVGDASDATRIFANTTLNGDGVIISESATDPGVAALITEIGACLGTVPDRSGKPGIDQAKADTFFADAAAFAGWYGKAEEEKSGILPAGDATGDAYTALQAIKGKVDDYFARCRLAAYDPRAQALLNRKEEEYLVVTTKDLSFHAAEVAHFPLAGIAPGKPLPLSDGLNPAHAGAVATLRAKAVAPLLGERASLTEADWLALQARLAPYDAWNAARAGGSVAKLGIKRVREVLTPKSRDAVNALIASDKALESEAASIGSVEKLTRFARDLHKLCLNFVNFRDLYDGNEPAIFQCGTLYLDQRSCTLCLTVEDAARHGTMAGLAGAYLAYCDCVRRGSGEKLSIVAIFSQGDDDNLMVGRNGVFYDRKGRDYDATITKIISNPISLRQAFWSPYKKFARMIEEQAAKRATAADAAATERLQKTAEATAKADATVAQTPGKAKVDVGMVAALGVAFGSLGTAMAYVLGLFKGVTPIQIVLALVGLVLLISGPAMILAYIKLRKRNLGPILDANGWAVNARARINVPFGASLTGIAKLPVGARRDLVDPFAEKKSPWPTLIVFAFILYLVYAGLNGLGFIHQWTGGRMGIDKSQPALKAAPVPAPAPEAAK
jgi:hypothetical protein